MTYRPVVTATAFVFLVLFVVLLCAPGVVFWLFALAPDSSALVLARRAGVLFLTLGFLLWLLRDSTDRRTQSAVTRAVPVGLMGIAALGLMEAARGAVGPGIYLAIAVEVALALALWRCRLADVA